MRRPVTLWMWVMGLILIIFAAVPFYGGPQDKNVRIASDVPLEWSDPANASKTPVFCNYAKVAVDENGKVHVIWVQGGGAGRQVYYNRTDDEDNFKVPVNLTAGEVRIGEGPWAEIQVDVNGNPNVVYSAVWGGNYEAVMKRYLNGRWMSHDNVSRTSYGGTAYPNLVIDRNNNDYYVFWQDDENRAFDEQVYWEILTRHLDGGEGNWIGGGALPDPNGRAYSPQADIDADGKIYLVYANRGSGNKTRVFFTENEDAKDWNTWSEPIDISGGTGISFAYPEMAVDWEGNVYVVWMDIRPGNIEVYFRKRVDGVWQEIENISESEVNSEDPSIAVNKETGEIYAAWEESKKIIMRVYSEGEWSDPVDMTENQSQSVRPHLFVSSTGAIHLVFSDDRTGQWNIYHRFKAGRPPDPPLAPLSVSLETVLDDSTTPNTKINIVKWKENPENEKKDLLNRFIYRKEEGQDDDQFAKIETFPLDTFIYSDTGLTTDTKYVYAFAAIDVYEQESGLSSPVFENRVFIPLGLGLETRINRVLFVSEKINYVSWEHNPLNDSVPNLQYNIYRKKSEDDDSLYELIHTAGGDILTYTDRGLEPSVKYTYSITVHDGEGHETPKLKTTIGEDGEA